MGSMNICPSAAVVVRAIIEKKPELSEKMGRLVKSHMDFIFAIGGFGTRDRDMSLAETNAEQAFAWALKSIGDNVLEEDKE